MTQKSRTTYVYYDTPLEVREVFQEICSKYDHFIDRIIDIMEVKFVPDTEGENFEAAINVRREYRTATVFLSGYFLKLSPEKRVEAVCHELSHIFSDPVYTEALSIIEHFVPGEVSEYVEEQLRKQNELMVDDLARFLVDCKSEKE